MGNHNTITLIGNLGKEARTGKSSNGNEFAAISIATTDSYKDKDGNWQEGKTIWHDVIAHSPQVSERLKNLAKGTRVEITAKIDYRPFETKELDKNGKPITRKEAIITATRVEQKPLVKKTEQAA